MLCDRESNYVMFLLAKALGCRLASIALGQACAVQQSKSDMPDRGCVVLQLIVGEVDECAR
eukprot:3048191-Pleurochrysis_carterae.AAC.1